MPRLSCLFSLNHSTTYSPAPRRTTRGCSNSISATSAICRSKVPGRSALGKSELPSGFRQFDYQTISDVVIHISYTAQQDDSLRVKVEANDGAIATALKGTLARLFSLRQEFPSVLNRMVHSPVNTSLTLSITPNYLPFFVASDAVQVARRELVLRTAASKTIEDFAVRSTAIACLVLLSIRKWAGSGRRTRAPLSPAAIRGSHDRRYQAGQSRSGSAALRGHGSDRRYEPARCDALRGISIDHELIRCGRRVRKVDEPKGSSGLDEKATEKSFAVSAPQVPCPRAAAHSRHRGEILGEPRYRHRLAQRPARP